MNSQSSAQIDSAANIENMSRVRMVESCREELGEEYPDRETLSAMQELAVRFRQQGHLTWAHSLFERVVAVQRRELGPRHLAVVSNEENLSETLFALGEIDGARALQERIVTARRLSMGEMHPLTLSAMSELAEILCTQGENETAAELQEFVLDTRILVLGEEHPDTQLAEDRLYETLLEMGALHIY